MCCTSAHSDGFCVAALRGRTIHVRGRRMYQPCLLIALLTGDMRNILCRRVVIARQVWCVHRFLKKEEERSRATKRRRAGPV
eukprot:13661146-Alexandrium_andersonii.AAC.1